jgi:serine/threonine protein kinase
LQQPGTLIEGKYEILGKIREGGMGAIYKVRHRLLDEVRVVKVMRPQVLADEDLKRRFVEEAKTATRLKHPNICTIHDFALDEDGTAYLVMEFIDGLTLADLSHSDKPVTLPMTLEIAQQALLALGYLHRRNVVHRDIAPDNLMLTSDEEGRPLVKLIDLGIAKALDRPGDMTSTGVFLGKLKYASPEQYGALPPGEKIDGRSDLYCLGLVLYELLTGARPFTGETPAEMLRAHLFAPPIPFEESDPEGRVPAELRTALLKALEKKREDRFATAEEFHREIVRIQAHVAASIDPDTTVAFVSSARSTREVGPVGITPSAQDRLDRRFAAQTTSHTSKAPRPSLEETRVARETKTPYPPSPAAPTARMAARPRTRPVQAPAAASPRRGFRLALLAAAIATLAVLLVLARSGKGSRAVAAAPAPTAAPANALLVVPTSLPVAETPAASVPVVEAPTRQPTEPPPAARTTRTEARPRPTAAPPRRTPVSVLAQNAERARNPVQIPAAGPTQPPVTNPPAAPPPTAAPRPQPTSPPADAPVAEPKAPTATEAEKIRDVIRRYERAQNALDADLFARVYPGADRARVKANFENFRSQNVIFDQIRIEVAPAGTKATVRMHERRVAVPRVGNEQQAEGERTILLRREGDNWIITGLQ